MIAVLAAAGCILLAAVLARAVRRLTWSADRAQLAVAEEDVETEYRIRDWRSTPTPDAERIMPLIRRRSRVVV